MQTTCSLTVSSPIKCQEDISAKWANRSDGTTILMRFALNGSEDGCMVCVEGDVAESMKRRIRAEKGSRRMAFDEGKFKKPMEYGVELSSIPWQDENLLQ